MLRLKFIWFFPFLYFFAYLCLYGRSNISTSLQELSFKWTYVRCIGREKQGIFLWCALETNRRQLSIAHYLAFLSLYLYSISVFLSLYHYHYISLFLSLFAPLSCSLSVCPRLSAFFTFPYSQVQTCVDMGEEKVAAFRTGERGRSDMWE